MIAFELNFRIRPGLHFGFRFFCFQTGLTQNIGFAYGFRDVVAFSKISYNTDKALKFTYANKDTK